MEDLLSTYDLMDIRPIAGLFTWSNKRQGPGHIAARLDRFLISSSILEESFVPSSRILPWSGSEHRPITLGLSPPSPFGPILFRFNPCWAEDPGFFEVIEGVLRAWIQGSPVYIWEQKIEAMKKVLREWVENKSIQERKEVQDLNEKMEEIMLNLEINPISSRMTEEQSIFQKHQKALTTEEVG